MEPISDRSILIFSGVLGDTRRYRTLHLYEQLRLAGADCVLSHLTDPRLPEYIQAAGITVLHRVAWDSYVERLVSELRRQGALIVLDADDFLYNPSVMRWIDSPDFEDPVRAALYRRELLRHKDTLEHCDAVTVSTGYLGRLIEPFGKPVRIHRNAYNLDMLRLADQAVRTRNRRDNRIVVGYASGTRTHDQDFAMIRPVLVELMERYAQVDLWLMGPVDPGPSWSNLRERVHVFPLVPWRELPGRLAQLDISLSPLVPGNPFNQSKSEIKFMESALVRVPVVASSTDAFQAAIENGQNGFLAASLDEWRVAISFLIENPAERRNMGERAYQDVVIRYAPWDRGQSYLNILRELAAQAGKALPDFTGEPLTVDPLDPPAGLFSAQAELRPTTADLARYSLLHRGVSTLLGQVWVYFRRKLAPIFPFRRKRLQ